MRMIEILKDESNSFGDRVRVLRYVDSIFNKVITVQSYTYPEGEWVSLGQTIKEFNEYLKAIDAK
jgi:hypothetical protein